MELSRMVRKTWHQKHADELSYPQKVADKLAAVIGSWRFILFQTVVIIFWMIMNVIAAAYRWDPYPFILLNLLFSTQAAYAAPIIMMSQNRQGERDRFQAHEDYLTNKQAKEEIEELQHVLARIENDKLDKLIRLIEEKTPVRSVGGSKD